MSIASVMPSSHLILWLPLLLLPSIFPSIRDSSNESAVCIRWPKYWSFCFSISHSNEYSGLTSLKIDWFDLLSVQGTLRSHLQHHSSKASILWHSVFFMVQFSQPYMTTGKTIALTIWKPVGRVMCLLFNTLARFVIAFQPRSSYFLISWLQSPSAVILEHKKRKSVTTSTFSHSICHDVMGLDAMILVFLIFSFKPCLSLSSFTFTKRLLSLFLLSAIRLVSAAYLRLLMFLLPIFIPACAKSTLPVFYKWNNGAWMSAYLFAMWLTDTALLTKLTFLDLLLRKKDFFRNISSHWQCYWSSKSSDGDVQWD